jgi:hypothetical protein
MAGTALSRNCRRPGRRRPVTLVAAIAFAGAWLRGWPPARLWRAAAWSLPMTGVYLAGRALQARTWRALALAPVHDWERAWHLAQAGHVIRAFVLCVPAGVPAAFCAAGLADLRHRDRHLREDRHRPRHLRRPPVVQAGSHRPRPHHRPRHRSPD